ncbi:BTB domain-containing protein [Nephila pilipes]|uniref:BTB domain-containing protein n=1 Tax=Nephila pilipes TaxID=299642 RepID=A0A8X6IXR0_NEPPI|nr:BTB domain-containing protein [Nephila pilipes]
MSCNSEIIDTSIDLIIKDFSSIIRPENEWICEKKKRCGDYIFCVSMDPSKGYMLVNVNEIRHSELSMLHETFDILRWTVCVIDVNGAGKHFQSFQRTVEFSSRKVLFYELVSQKFLKLFFLLEHADELLPGDVLTLRFDISYISCAGMKKELEYGHLAKEWQEMNNLSNKELSSTNMMNEREMGLLNKHLFRNGNVAMKNSNNVDCSTHDISLKNNEKNINNKKGNSTECNYKLDENDWVIKSSTKKIVISLIEGKISVGSKLISASPVFKCMVNIDMAEKHSKCIDLSHVKIEILMDLLYYLDNGILRDESFFVAQELYILAHMYMMEELQYVCAIYIAKSLNCVNFNYVKTFADFFADNHLLKLVNSKYYEIFGITPRSCQVQEGNDRPDFNCYV